jgi:predicted RNase H-like HicB family nuclease
MLSLVKREHLLWVLVTQAEDLPGSWIARVLDLGLTTQADSLDEAFEMARDALRLAIVSDVEKGLDPFTRKRAAPEYWEVLEGLIRNPNRSRLGDLSPEQRNRVSAAATQLAVSEVKQVPESLPIALEPWQFAQLEKLRGSCQPS